MRQNDYMWAGMPIAESSGRQTHTHTTSSNDLQRKKKKKPPDNEESTFMLRMYRFFRI